MEVTFTYFQALKMSCSFDTGGKRGMQVTPVQAGDLESVRVVRVSYLDPRP